MWPGSNPRSGTCRTSLQPRSTRSSRHRASGNPWTITVWAQSLAPPEPINISFQLRKRPPSYMIPTWFEQVAAIPMKPTEQARGDVRPAHTRRPTRATAHVAPSRSRLRTSHPSAIRWRGPKDEEHPHHPEPIPPDLLVHLVATVCAIVGVTGVRARLRPVGARTRPLERPGDRARRPHRPGPRGTVCLLVPLMRQLIHG